MIIPDRCIPAHPVVILKYASLQWHDEGAVTTFLDGSSYGAHPHPWDHHYTVAAHRMGYEDDLLRYCREHELAHLIVEEWLHDRPSRILWGLAHEQPLSPYEAAYEEAAAQMLQRYVRTNEQPLIGNVNWAAMKEYFLRKLESQ